MIIQYDNSTAKNLHDAYNGTGGFFDGSNLVRFVRENTTKFIKRQAIASYDNNVQTIVDANINPVTTRVFSALADNSPYEFNTFYEDCDGKGTTLRDWVSDNCLNAHLLGFVIYYFDDFGVKVDNLKDQIDNKVYPKLQSILPQQVISYEIDGRGNITYLQFYKNSGLADNLEIVELTNSNNTITKNVLKPKSPSDKKEVTDREIGKIFYSDTDRKDELKTNISLFSFKGLSNSFELPTSSHLSLLTQALATYRLDSLINYQNHENTFPFLHTTDMSLKADNFKLNEEAIVKTAENTIFEPKTTGYTADKVRESSQEIKTQMYQNYNLNVNIGANSSGESRAYADNLRVQQLQAKSMRANNLELKLVQEFFGLLKNVEFKTEYYDLRYPSDFAPESMDRLLNQAQKVLDMQISPENEVLVKTTALNGFYANDDTIDSNQIETNEKMSIDINADENGEVIDG